MVLRYESSPLRAPPSNTATRVATRPSPSNSLWRIRQRQATPDLLVRGPEKARRPGATPSRACGAAPGGRHAASESAGTLPEALFRRESNLPRILHGQGPNDGRMGDEGRWQSPRVAARGLGTRCLLSPAHLIAARALNSPGLPH